MNDNKISLSDLSSLLSDTIQKFPVGSRWRHYKGGEYIITGVCVLQASSELAIRYCPIDRPMVEFVRAISGWEAEVPSGLRRIRRFVQLTTNE